MSDTRNLRNQVATQAKRIRKAEQEKSTLLAQTVFTGTLGLLLVLPIVAGAYIGHWLDNLGAGYSVKWTLSMLILGVLIGAMNVYLFIKERN